MDQAGPCGSRCRRRLNTRRRQPQARGRAPFCVFFCPPSTSLLGFLSHDAAMAPQAQSVLAHADRPTKTETKVLRLQIMGGASPYLGAVRAEHVGPAASSLRVALFEPPELGALSSVRRRRANVRSRSEIRKFASEGTKQGGNNHQTTILGLVRPTAHELSRAGFPPPLALSCCGTYLQGGNGVDVHGDSA